MDFIDIFKPMDNNSRIKGNPSIWSTAQLSLLVIREMLGCFLGCELVLMLMGPSQICVLFWWSPKYTLEVFLRALPDQKQKFGSLIDEI